MKSLPLALSLVFLIGCNTQEGYDHSRKDFTAFDERAIERVQQMALGRLELLSSTAAEYTDEESPEVHPCDYRVRKIIRRDWNQIEGKYPEEIEVVCTTVTDDSKLLRFSWTFDTHLERIREFKFGFDPSEFEPDE
jgi:hypothetical protein